MQPGKNDVLICRNYLRDIYGGGPEIPIFMTKNGISSYAPDFSTFVLTIKYILLQGIPRTFGLIVTPRATTDQLYMCLENMIQPQKNKKLQITLRFSEENIQNFMTLCRNSKSLDESAVSPDGFTCVIVKLSNIQEILSIKKEVIEENKNQAEDDDLNIQIETIFDTENDGMTEEQRLEKAIRMSLECNREQPESNEEYSK